MFDVDTVDVIVDAFDVVVVDGFDSHALSRLSDLSLLLVSPLFSLSLGDVHAHAHADARHTHVFGVYACPTHLGLITVVLRVREK